MKARARKEGKKPVAYHGVFSTHPDNDKRLQEVIAAASKLSAAEPNAVDPAEYRRVMEGLKFSEAEQSATIVGNRYYNGKMGFTVAFPSDWKIVKRSSTVLAGPNKDGTILQMLVKRARPELTPAQYTRDVLKLQGLRQEEKIESDEILGSMALYPGPRGGPARRIAVLYFGSYAYIFDGRTSNASLSDFYDTMFVSTVNSFRPMTDEDRSAALGIRIRYVRAEEGMTFAKLAEVSPLKSYPEEMLRLINGYYPRGEPGAGEWIKVFN
jgi:predicted Zn-dependent protease